MCETAEDLEKFIRSFEKVPQRFGLTMNIMKICLMLLLQQLKEDQHRKVLKRQKVNHDDVDISIRKQKIKITDSSMYLGCTVTNDLRQDVEISAWLAKAAKAFNMLRYTTCNRKSVSIKARRRIFGACVTPVLLYGCKTWPLTIKQEPNDRQFLL